MARVHSNAFLREARRKILDNPRADYDDELFYALVRATWLLTEVYTDDRIREDHGKKYLSVHFDGSGKKETLRRIILDFADKYLLLDGLILDGLIIEKGFIEEIISAVDSSMMTAIADDISSYETDAAAVADESLSMFPSIQKWNSEALLTISRVASGDRFTERLSSAYRNLLDKTKEAGYRTLSIAPLSDAMLQNESAIATSAVSIWFSLHPDYPLAVTFVLPGERELQAFLS